VSNVAFWQVLLSYDTKGEGRVFESNLMAGRRYCLHPEHFAFGSGRRLATDDEKIGTRLWHAQWASPSSGKLGGKTLIFFGGGDRMYYLLADLFCGAAWRNCPIKTARFETAFGSV